MRQTCAHSTLIPTLVRRVPLQHCCLIPRTFAYLNGKKHSSGFKRRLYFQCWTVACTHTQQVSEHWSVVLSCITKLCLLSRAHSDFNIPGSRFQCPGPRVIYHRCSFFKAQSRGIFQRRVTSRTDLCDACSIGIKLYSRRVSSTQKYVYPQRGRLSFIDFLGPFN